MRNIQLVLEYDGSQFFGFQRQPKHLSVQQALEEALSKALDRKTKISAASGRTDTGVHASHQVVNFKTNSKRTLEEIQRGVNHYLPKAAAILSVREMPANFHARFSAIAKTYEYRIWNSRVRSPLEAARVHQVPEKLNIAIMRKAARILTGKHDFRSFCASGSRALDEDAGKTRGTVRTIKKFEIKKKGLLVTIRIEADGFLYRMVRNLAGCLIRIGQERMSFEDLKAVLEGKDRRLAPSTAPAHALTLVDVRY